jgi:DNA polymerase-3 subunit gamma/tau
VGKTTTARLLAKAVNCLNPDNANPDNTCELCTEINSGQSFNVLEIDGASNRGIDEIRSLRESVRFPPAKGAKKVYIIDEVHMLTKEAFNALLKTLEEPPRHVLFIFATTEIHKLPATILSRCQRFDFRRLSGEEITGNLRMIAAKDNITLDDDSLRLLARKADGSLRDAQSLFDQAISLCGTTITHEDIRRELRIVDLETFFRVTEMVKRKDPKAALQIVEEIINQGYDPKEFLEGVIEHLRNIMVVKTTGSTELVEAADGIRDRYRTSCGSSAFWAQHMPRCAGHPSPASASKLT